MLRKKSHFSVLGLLLLSCVVLLAQDAGATIFLFGNTTGSYPSLEASFTPAIPDAGIKGEAYAADPLNGCSAFSFKVTDENSFAVIQRGECLFETKVRNSQNAGFRAAIVFDDTMDDIVIMSGDGKGVTAYAVFVGKTAGKSLLNLNGSVYILPEYKKKTWAITWLILSVCLVVIVIVGALVTALCCIRAHILAEAEKEALSEKLLQDDDYILNSEFVPDDNGLEARAQDFSEFEGAHSNVPRSGGPSESEHTTEEDHILPK